MRHGESAPVLVAVLLAGSALLSGCATQAPVTEVRLISDSFKTLDAASQPLLDDLAAAEREQGKRAALIRAQQRTAATGPAAHPHPGRCTRSAIFRAEASSRGLLRRRFRQRLSLGF